ncbi:4722_t:CDS:2 [Racocetra fulgida]|uniref:4722_t:CDS:1 n=1 Tax=Racocetra fulgida TaxID=60492 RepID=A0A9N9BN03_9GLOM|nr:4722_t:CDS:2 [Racocetra fulgida]
MTSIISTFDEKEKKSISELKELLPDIVKDSGVPENYTLWGVSLDKNSTDERLDVILVKYLRARTDDILTESFPSDTFCKVGFIHKHDKKNRPITYNLYGGLKNEEVFGNLDRFLRWRVQLMEKGIQLLDFKTVDQMIQVHDYNLVTFASYDKTAKTANWVFKFISVFLNEQTKAKFVVTSAGGVKDSMLAVIDEDNLPVAYGGKSIVPELENKKSENQPSSE